MARATQYVALRALLADHGWSDSSNADQDRLTACAGAIGLIVHRDGIELFHPDMFTGDVVRIKVVGGWSYGTVVNMCLHLMMIYNASRKD